MEKEIMKLICGYYYVIVSKFCGRRYEVVSVIWA